MTKVLGGFVVFADAVGSTSSTKKLFVHRTASTSSSWWLKNNSHNNIGGARSNGWVFVRSSTSSSPITGRNRSTAVVRRRSSSPFCFVPSSSCSITSSGSNDSSIFSHSSSSSRNQFHSTSNTRTTTNSLTNIINKSSNGSLDRKVMMSSMSTNKNDILSGTSGLATTSYPQLYLLQSHQGNWAGQVSKFSSVDGSVIPVPEHLVPESMVEWGQIPPQLEQFTTDVFTSKTNEEDDLNEITLERTTIQVLPEVGCGIDNLETTKSKTNVEEMSIQWCDNEQPLRVVLPSLRKDEITLSSPLCYMVQQQQQPLDDSTETSNTPPPPSFVMILPKKTFGKKNNKQQQSQVFTTHVYFVSSENKKQQQQRIRVMLDVEVSNQNDESSPCINLVSPIEVVLERQTSSTPSTTEGGYIGDGGGLDARTVAQLVGVNNINKPFATWRDDLVVAPENAEDISSAHRTTIQIPCGVTISVDDHKGILHVMVSEKMFHKYNEKDNDDELQQTVSQNTQSVSIQFVNE